MSYTPYNPGYVPTFVPTNITTGKLGYESTPFDLAFTGTPNGQETPDGIVGPNAIYELMRQVWTPEILEHKFAQNLLIWVFNAPISDDWMNKSHCFKIGIGLFTHFTMDILSLCFNPETILIISWNSP